MFLLIWLFFVCAAGLSVIFLARPRRSELHIMVGVLLICYVLAGAISVFAQKLSTSTTALELVMVFIPTAIWAIPLLVALPWSGNEILRSDGP